MVGDWLKALVRRDGPADPREPVVHVRDRRKTRRLSVLKRSNLFVSMRPMAAVVVDISPLGARVATRLPRDVGQVVGLEIEVDEQSMSLPLLLLWERWEGGAFEAGGEFVHLNPEEQAHLERFIASLPPRPLRRGLKPADLLKPVRVPELATN